MSEHFHRQRQACGKKLCGGKLFDACFFIDFVFHAATLTLFIKCYPFIRCVRLAIVVCFESYIQFEQLKSIISDIKSALSLYNKQKRVYLLASSFIKVATK